MYYVWATLSISSWLFVFTSWLKWLGAFSSVSKGSLRSFVAWNIVLGLVEVIGLLSPLVLVPGMIYYLNKYDHSVRGQRLLWLTVMLVSCSLGASLYFFFNVRPGRRTP
jgi:hypothetical protein